ncbi:hypothetical protein GE061_013182, partial [Apolygus lucorum]
MGMSTLNNSKNDLEAQHDDPWDVDTEEEEEEDEEGQIKDDELLTMLVRKSYLKHLERCLKKNYEDSNKATIEQDEVAFHAKQLEKKALRLSMRVGIYQRYMVRE